jgi:predicted ester cyclase
MKSGSRHPPGRVHGSAPTGSRVKIAAVAMVHICEGKIAEMRGAPDILGLMQQIGAVPAPEQSEEASPT